ncbi:MAG: hypothetical protein R3208_22080 [Ketobacteraceae bacterium]|nr:hypothetical protein [Ketobacteraceae bacterium]
MCYQVAGGVVRSGLLVSAFVVSGCAHSGQTPGPNPQTICGLVESTINLDKLQQYYHIDSFPERIPLVVTIANQDVDCPDLEKFGMAVKVQYRSAEAAPGDTAYKTSLDIKAINFENDTAQVYFSYPPEGIRGEIEFKKVSFDWRIQHSVIVEM